jgi:hypothetical protein
LQIKVDDFHGPSQKALQTNLLHDEVKKLSLIYNLLNNHGENMDASLF